MKIAIIRHKRENLKKCSLRGLEKKDDFSFYTYPSKTPLPSFSDFLLLKIGAPPLTENDKGRNILLIDATWRLAPMIERHLPQNLEARSLPSTFRTAYPRKQTDCPDPMTGLASIEALYLAFRILGKPSDHLLDHYYWKEQFLQLNQFI
ncbi:MAG: hypothetical protein FJZ64_02035 [Chlamydiae bacterium]|nr:hypothetical protein [Chlamydiota bacterium]